jgi:hypothetical protein
VRSHPAPSGLRVAAAAARRSIRGLLTRRRPGPRRSLLPEARARQRRSNRCCDVRCAPASETSVLHRAGPVPDGRSVSSCDDFVTLSEDHRCIGARSAPRCCWVADAASAFSPRRRPERGRGKAPSHDSSSPASATDRQRCPLRSRQQDRARVGSFSVDRQLHHRALRCRSCRLRCSSPGTAGTGVDSCGAR